MAGIASSSTVGQETLATFCCGECSRIRRLLFVCNGLGKSSSLIAVEWVSVEGIMDIVCIDVILFGQLYSIQLADPKIFKVF